MDTLIKEGYQKYRNGDSMSDEQLDALIKNHRSLLVGLDKLNDRRFDLFRNQIRSDLYSFEGMQEARKRHK